MQENVQQQGPPIQLQIIPQQSQEVLPVQGQNTPAQPSTTSSHGVHSEEINEHIDSVINDVANGLGTIPYGSDFDDEETTCSSFKDTASDSQYNQFDTLNESMNSVDKFLSQKSGDGSSTDQQQKQGKQPAKRKTPGSNKINKQLQARVEADQVHQLQQFQGQLGQQGQPQQFIQVRLNEDGSGYVCVNLMKIK